MNIDFSKTINLANSWAPKPSWSDIKITRNTLLQLSDWTQGADSPLSTELRAEWATYRQALRDITTQDIHNIVWPTKPE